MRVGPILPALLLAGCYLSHGADARRDGGGFDGARPDAARADAARRDAGPAGPCGATEGRRLELEVGPAEAPRVVDCPAAAPTPPCPGLCGNGSIDSCGLGGGTVETCDGSAACPSGFAGGTACCESCVLDVIDCEECRGASGVERCEALPTGLASDSLFGALGVGAGAPGAAFAWTIGSPTGGRLVVVDTLAEPDSTPSPPVCLAIGDGSVFRVDIAPTRDGFRLAATTADATEIAELDATGRPRGRAYRLVDLHGARLHARPDGGSLLVAGVGSQVDGVGVDPDGTPRWRTRLAEYSAEPSFGGAVHVDGHMLVALRAEEARIAVLTIEDDGELVCDRTVFPEDAEYPFIDARDGEIQLTFTSFGDRPGGARWLRLDPTGAPLGDPVALEGGMDTFNPAPIRLVPGGALVLVGGYTGGTYVAGHLDLHRLDASGGYRAPVERVVENPDGDARHRLVRWGDALLAAWLRGGPSAPSGIGFAVLRP